MLPDQATQFLTAFVDRELRQRQRKTVMRLLRKSSEARAMLRQLQENALKLNQLPRRKIEPSLVDQILQAIAEQQAQPKQPVVNAARRHSLPSIAASMAAALLIGVLGIIYWTTIVEPGSMKDKELVENDRSEKKPGPSMDPVFNAKFSELNVGKNMKSERIQQLKHEVERVSRDDKAIQLDITVASNSKAIERLKQVRDLKLNLITDQSTAKPIDDKTVQYFFYAENLTSVQVTEMLCKLARSSVVSMGEKNVAKSVPSPYQTLTLTPIAKDSEEIARVAPKRNARQAGMHQILIRIHQE